MQSEKSRCEHAWHNVSMEDMSNPWTSIHFQEYSEMGLFDGPYDPDNCPTCGEAVCTVTCYRCEKCPVRIDPSDATEPRERHGICFWCNEELSDETAGYPAFPSCPAVPSKIGWLAPVLPIPYDVVEPDSEEYDRLYGLAMDAWTAIENAGAFLPAKIEVGPHDGIVVVSTSTDRQAHALTPADARELAHQLLETAAHVEATEQWAQTPAH